MKARLLRFTMCLLTVLMISTLMALPVSARSPLPDENQQGRPAPGTTLLTPGEFTVYFEDQYRTRISFIYDTSPFYMIIETPVGWTNIYASCVVSYPNGIQNTIFTNKFLGAGGVYRIGPYRFEPQDPQGQYIFRVELRYIDASAVAQVSQNTGFIQYQARPYPHPYPYPPSPYPPSPYPYTLNILSFSASPSTIRAGEAVTLSWNVTGASTITIDQGVGTVQSSGSYTVTPGATTTYTLTASSYGGGTANRSLTVTVEPPLPPPLPSAPQPPQIVYVTPPPATTPPTTTTPTTTPLPSDNWLMYLLIGLLVVIVAAILIVFMLNRSPAVSTAGPGTLPPPPPPVPVAAPPGRLVLPDNSELPMTGTVTSLGRSNFSRAVPPDQLSYISRNHIQLSYENGRYYIQDMGSTNGTRLNGAEIKGTGRREVRNGDIIELGNVARVSFRAY